MEIIIKDIIEWCNQNSGFVSVTIFASTIFIGWISGFFSLLIKKPKFKIEIIEEATFYTTMDLKRTHQGLPVHKTAFVLYLEITNNGNAPSSIGQIKIGYFTDNNIPIWRAKRIWLYETALKSQIISKFDKSELVKGYPFLKQKINLYSETTETFLEVGRIENGIVYFEEMEAFGSWMPRLNKDNKTTNIKLKIKDAFGKYHTKKINVKMVEPDLALQMSPYFGQTLKEYFISKNKTENVAD